MLILVHSQRLTFIRSPLYTTWKSLAFIRKSLRTFPSPACHSWASTSPIQSTLYLNVTPREWMTINIYSSVLTVSNYIYFLSNIQILMFINISNCEESLWEITITANLRTQSKLHSISNLQITGEVWINGYLVRFILWLYFIR